jgi:hypothetical protein
LSESLTDLFHQWGIPGGSESNTSGETGRGRRSTTLSTAGAVRTIGDLHDRDAKALIGNCMPEVYTGKEGYLLFEGHLVDQGLDFLFIHDHVFFLNMFYMYWMLSADCRISAEVRDRCHNRTRTMALVEVGLAICSTVS